jgi:Ca2+-binding EF-hand superfamily protein
MEDTEIEYLKLVFSKYDTQKSGYLTPEQFNKLVIALIKYYQASSTYDASLRERRPKGEGKTDFIPTQTFVRDCRQERDKTSKRMTHRSASVDRRESEKNPKKPKRLSEKKYKRWSYDATVYPKVIVPKGELSGATIEKLELNNKAEIENILLDSAVINAVFMYYDTNNDSLLSFEELRVWWSSPKKFAIFTGDISQILKKARNLFLSHIGKDAKQMNFIEFENLIDEYNLHQKESTFDDMDKNDDGLMSFREFVNWFGKITLI